MPKHNPKKSNSIVNAVIAVIVSCCCLSLFANAIRKGAFPEPTNTAIRHSSPANKTELVVISTSAVSDKPTSLVPQIAAWDACRNFIADQKDLPQAGAQAYISQDVKTVESNKYDVRIYYSKEGKLYTCKIWLLDGGNWALLSLDFIQSTQVASAALTPVSTKKIVATLVSGSSGGGGGGASTPSYPSGATALCVDGTYSYAASHRGACSHHGGVAK